jgi:DNA-binding transcriptional ArsR family regulator
VTKKDLSKSSKKKPLSRYAGLKLLLIQDKDTILEIPLTQGDWSRERLDDELTSMEIKFEQFSKIFDALSHETRLRMMKHILGAEDQTTSFAEFMHDLDLNPKLVWENTRKLYDGGLVEKVEKGRYRCSEFGRMEFMMNLALRRLMETLEGLES